MSLVSQTSTALLEGLAQSPNGPHWDEFAGRFRPVLIGVARRAGLDATVAEDVAQEALTECLQAYRAGKYDRSRGRLSAWLLGITRFRIQDAYRRHKRDCAGGDSAIALLADERHLSGMWADECRREILRRAVESLRTNTRMDATTIRAFELLACEGLGPADAAARLGISVNEVYVAKHRALDRLREIVAEYSRAFESDISE